MIRTLTLSLSAGLLLASSLGAAIQFDATTISGDFPNDSEFPILSNDGTPVPAGNRVVIGGFNYGGLDRAAFFGLNGSSLTSLYDAFQPISDTFELSSLGSLDFTIGEGGTFDLTIGTMNDPEAAGFASTDPVFMWVFKTSDNGTDLGADFANVTQYGLFSSASTEWTFQDGNPPRLATLRTGDIDDFIVSGNGDLSLALVGGLAPIPEPSVLALLLGLGTLAGLSVRRRR